MMYFSVIIQNFSLRVDSPVVLMISNSLFLADQIPRAQWQSGTNSDLDTCDSYTGAEGHGNRQNTVLGDHTLTCLVTHLLICQIVDLRQYSAKLFVL